MGKKAKFKAIRRMSENMPVINVNGIERTLVSGQDLIDKGIITIPMGKIAEEQVHAAKTYVQKKPVAVALNHNRRMKEAYNKFGSKGVQLYISEVARFEKNIKEKQDANHTQLA